MKTALHKRFNSYKSRGIVKAAGRGGGSLTLSVMPPKTMRGCRRDLGAHGTAPFAAQSQAVPAQSQCGSIASDGITGACPIEDEGAGRGASNARQAEANE